MHREIEYSPDQQGYGLSVTNPVTGTRVLVGIFGSRADAHRFGAVRRAVGTIHRPRVVTWNQKTYKRYEHILEK